MNVKIWLGVHTIIRLHTALSTLIRFFSDTLQVRSLRNVGNKQVELIALALTLVSQQNDLCLYEFLLITTNMANEWLLSTTELYYSKIPQPKQKIVLIAYFLKK